MDAIRRLDSPPVATRMDPVVTEGKPAPASGTESSDPAAGTEATAPSHSPREQESIAPQESAPLDLEQLAELVESIQESLDQASPDPHKVQFRPLEKSRDYVIEILDRETGELITQFPPEKILNLRKRLDELVGMVVDRKI